MNYYALIYYLVDDYLQRRASLRDDHLRLSRDAHRKGELLLAGAFSDPSDRAMLVFRVKETSSIEEFVRKDPYFINGLVTRYEIRPWVVVVGA